MRTAHLTNKYRLKHEGNKIYSRLELNDPPNQQIERWFTPKEAATYLGIGYKRLLNLSSSGIIPYRKLGRLNRYLRFELDQLLNQQKRGPIV